MPKKVSYLPDDSSTPRAKKAAAKAKPAPKSSMGTGGGSKATAKPAAKAKSTPAAKPATGAKRATPKTSLGAGARASKATAAKRGTSSAPPAKPAGAATAKRKPLSSLGAGGKAAAPKSAAAKATADSPPPPAPKPVAAAPAEPPAPAPTPAPAAEPGVRYVEVPVPPAPPSRRQINEAVVLAVLAARREDDQTVLRRLLADDVALHLPAEEPIVGKDNLLEVWDRQAELLEDVASFEADLHSVAGGDDHAFTYVETRTEAGGAPIAYTTLTAYRIRNGQVVEIRQHVDNLMGYLSFWRELEGGAGAAGAESPEEEPPPRPKGFARFFR